MGTLVLMGAAGLAWAGWLLRPREAPVSLARLSEMASLPFPSSTVLLAGVQRAVLVHEDVSAVLRVSPAEMAAWRERVRPLVEFRVGAAPSYLDCPRSSPFRRYLHAAESAPPVPAAGYLSGFLDLATRRAQAGGTRMFPSARGGGCLFEPQGVGICLDVRAPGLVYVYIY